MFAPHARRYGFAVLLAFSLTANAQSPLEVVPADAKVVIMINNLERTMQGSEKFAQAIGQPAPPPDLSQLTQFMGELGSQWKVQRGVALAVIQPAQDGMVAVFPVDDAPAALKAAKAEMKGEVGSFDMFGTMVYGTGKGRNLLVSAGEASLKAFSTEKSLAAAMTPAQTKLADGSSVFVYLNIQSLKPLIDEGFKDDDQLKRMFEKLAERNKAINPEQAVEMTKKIVKALSEQAKSLYIGFQIDEKAAVARIGVELLPDSKVRGKLANYRSSGTNVFATLPPSNFIAAFGVDAAALATLNDRQEGPKVTGVSGAVSLDKDSTLAMIRIDSPDASMINDQLKGLVGVGQMMAAANAQGKIEFANAQKKVGGVDVGEITVKNKGTNEKIRQAVTAVAGGNDIFIQHGVVGQAVGLTISGKPDAFSTLQAGGSLGAGDRLRAASGMLPSNSVFTLLVDPVNALQLGKRIARGTGQESPLATANIPETGGFPIGAALSVEPDGMIFHIAVPSAAIKDVMPIAKNLD
jgi:hypothetical protein